MWEGSAATTQVLLQEYVPLAGRSLPFPAGNNSHTDEAATQISSLKVIWVGKC